MAAPNCTQLLSDEKLRASLTRYLNANVTRRIKETMLGPDTAYRERALPSDRLLIQLAVEAYSDNPDKMIEGWELLTTASNDDIGNGYFGVAYWNGAEQQVVIAHRGTPFELTWNAISALYNDYHGVWVNKLNAPQVKSAITFTNMIRDMINELNRERGIYVQLSITGHSLGGWLAQITTLSVKHLAPYTDILGNADYFLQNHQQNTQLHAHTVAFDSPGSKEIFTKLQSDLFDRHGSEFSLDDLDVTIYLSAPNMVNTKNEHIKSKVYRIFIDLSHYKPSQSWLSTDWFTYHLSFTHDKLKILKLFESGQILKEEVLDWPQFHLTQPEEYKKIFETANKSNNFVPQPNVTWSDHRDIRYSTRSVDPKVLKMSYLSQQERKLLFGYQLRRQFNALNEPLLSNGDPTANEYMQIVHNGIRIRNNELHCETNDLLLKLVYLIRRCCHLYPDLSVTPFESDDIMRSSFQRESDDFLSSISNNSLDFNENADLRTFLTSTPQLNNNEISCNKFHWVEETTSVGALKVYRGSQKAGVRDNCRFLSFNQLQMLSKHINLKEYLATNRELFLVIECRSDCSSEEGLSLWNSFPEHTNKLVLITDQRFQLPESNTNRDDRGVQFNRLTDDTKQRIENKLISIQDHLVTLKSLEIAEDLSTATLITIGLNPIDLETLLVVNELEALSEEAERCYIGRTLRMCTINQDIICSINLNSDDVFVNWSVDNNNGLLIRDEQVLFLNNYMEVKLQVATVSKILDKVVFVIGKAGMGKTTLFTHLANKIKIWDPTLWVIQMNFSQLVQYYEVSDNSIFDTLIRALHLRLDIEIDFLKIYLNLKKIVLFLDGVDQISQHKDRVEPLVKDVIEQRESFHQIWLSCRRESTYRQLNQGHTESSTAYTLQPFTQKEQRQFLRKLWSRNIRYFNDDCFNKYFDELIKSFHHLIGGKYDDFTRNPRILHILGEHFHDQFQQFNYFNKSVSVSMCQLWLSYRCIIVKYLNQSSDDSDVLNSILKKCQLVALDRYNATELKYLLSPDEMKELESIKTDADSELAQLWIFHEMLTEPTNQVSCFINGSFDEYFAAEYLIDQINKPVQKDIKEDKTMNQERQHFLDTLGIKMIECDKKTRELNEEYRDLKRLFYFTRLLKAGNKIVCDRFEHELNQTTFSENFKKYTNQFQDKISTNEPFVMTRLAPFYSSLHSSQS